MAKVMHNAELGLKKIGLEILFRIGRPAKLKGVEKIIIGIIFVILLLLIGVQIGIWHNRQVQTEIVKIEKEIENFDEELLNKFQQLPLFLQEEQNNHQERPPDKDGL